MEKIISKIGHQQIIFKKRKYEKSKFNLKIIFIFLLQILYTFTVVKKGKINYKAIAW